MNAKQVQIIQGTPEWHEWRRKGIGASDVAALFSKSPYKTKRDLWFEKAGLGEPDDEDRSYIFREGHKAEASLRKKFSEFAKFEFKPACFEKDEIFLASLDGYEKTIALLEAKLVSREALKKANDGEIPEHHGIQIQSQLHSSDSDKAFWIGRAPGVKEDVVVEIGRKEKMIKSIVIEVTDFWNSIHENRIPELTSEDTLFLHSPEQIALFRELRRLKSEKDSLEEKYSELEAAAKALAIHDRVKCEGVLIFQAERAGSIDYLKIPEVKALSEDYLEGFRKKSSKYKSIRFGKAE